MLLEHSFHRAQMVLGLSHLHCSRDPTGETKIELANWLLTWSSVFYGTVNEETAYGNPRKEVVTTDEKKVREHSCE